MRIKYPRTYHLPWSPGATKDDKVLSDCRHFEGKHVVVTVKMDGENTTLYKDYLHARSVDGRSHPSRSWIKSLHSQVAHDIPEGWRVCGENLYARHSIYYPYLPSYFMVFAIFNEQNICLNWDQTVEWANLLGLQVVPLLYRGLWNEKEVRAYNKTAPLFGEQEIEGYVVRNANAFHFSHFRYNVAKYVRVAHISTDKHWMTQIIQPNRLAIGK